MGSYQRFPKCSPASEAAMRRDQEWREAELRRAVRLPKPAERIDPSNPIGIGIGRLDIAERLRSPQQPTRH
ncbi:MAG: hypothetical protein ABWY66_11410 [Xanthobacteraceae bacterium]|jgi:hypothetical protein